MIVRFIGDVHGKLEQYAKLTETSNKSVCLGEMGFGECIQILAKMYTSGRINGDDHIIIPGNHDHYGVIDGYPTFLTNPGYGILDVPLDFINEGVKVFYVRGAASIDKQYRRVGMDWFPEEELRRTVLDSARAFYNGFRPDLMVTHTCPDALTAQLIPDGATVFHFNTEVALQVMLDQWAPKIWIFGHMHRTGVYTVPGCETKFIGLGELATCDLDLDTGDVEVCPAPVVGWG